MKAFSIATFATASYVGSAVAQSLPSISIKGSKFFYPNGTQFFIRGVAYQQDYQGGNGNSSTSTSTTYTDPLSLPDSCRRDIPYLQQLSTNTIRVYAVDPNANHDDCMNQLQAAGIYVIADLSAPVEGQSINRDSPAWDDDLYARYTSVVDSLQKYSNVIGFFAGNEVSNNATNTNAAPFVKAAVRDTKAYIKSKGYRSSLSVGYATDDDASIRDQIADFFNCGDQSSAVDFWGYNIYSWCGDSSYTMSGYDQRTAFFKNFSVPAFFAEYGCNKVEPRPFTEVQALYGPQMSPVWSGGIVYMYFQEENNYGLVDISNNTVTPNQGFSNLKSQLAAVTPSSVNSNSYTPTNSPQACPAVQSSVWAADPSPLPPSPNELLCSCMYANLNCIVKPSTNPTDYGDLFNYVFSNTAGGIPGIVADGTTGTYGAYSMCNSTQKLGFALNAYYLSQKSNKQACDFGGKAQTQAAAAPSSCSSLIAQAGVSGLGTVTALPNPTGINGQTGNAGATGPSGASGAVSTSSHKGAAAPRGVPSVFRPSEVGIVPVIAISALAAISGIGMIFL